MNGGLTRAGHLGRTQWGSRRGEEQWSIWGCIHRVPQAFTWPMRGLRGTDSSDSSGGFRVRRQPNVTHLGSPHALPLPTTQTLLSASGKWTRDRTKCSSFWAKHSEQCLTCPEHTDVGCWSVGSTALHVLSVGLTPGQGKRGNHPKIF